MTDREHRPPAYVLAGGSSSRFGSDKARAEVAGQPLVVRIAEALRPSSSHVTVVADSAAKYADLDLRTIADRVRGAGPLGGLDAAIADAGAEDWLVIASCDLVVIRPEWLSLLLDSARAEDQVVVFRHERWEPFPGLYHASLGSLVREQIDAGSLAMWRLIERCRARALPLPPDWPAVVQANTPAELAAAQAAAGGLGDPSLERNAPSQSDLSAKCDPRDQGPR